MNKKQMSLSQVIFVMVLTVLAVIAVILANQIKAAKSANAMVDLSRFIPFAIGIGIMLSAVGSLGGVIIWILVRLIRGRERSPLKRNFILLTTIIFCFAVLIIEVGRLLFW